MQVQLIVHFGFSTRRINQMDPSHRRDASRLHHYILWWVNATNVWKYEDLIKWFCAASFDINPAAFAIGLLLRHIRESHSATTCDLLNTGVGRAVAASAA